MILHIVMIYIRLVVCYCFFVLFMCEMDTAMSHNGMNKVFCILFHCFAAASKDTGLAYLSFVRYSKWLLSDSLANCRPHKSHTVYPQWFLAIKAGPKKSTSLQKVN